MALSPETRQRIASLIESGDVVLFMKGNRLMPQCGFSQRVVQLLDQLLPDYTTVDVLEDQEVREGVKEYSSWPTIPQLYIHGELIGGSDIVTEMFSSGELHEKLGLQVPEATPPAITISDAAAAKIREYAERAPGKELHLSVDARFQSSLGLAPRQDGEIEVRANGITVLMDPLTAQRANGLSIDLVDTGTGHSFRVENPNSGATVKELTPPQLKKLLEEGARLELFDVRTPEERATARIEAARFFDAGAQSFIESLPKDTMLVFHCHHGGRSQQAAEHFCSRGFTNVHNLVGGIDAWSLQVDPGVTRY